MGNFIDALFHITANPDEPEQINTEKFHDELEQARPQYVRGRNHRLDNCGSYPLNYCARYYSRYLVFGESYLGDCIEKAIAEDETDSVRDYTRVRACVLKNEEVVRRYYGDKAADAIEKRSFEYIKANDELFIDFVIDLGTKIAKYIKTQFSLDELLPGDDSLVFCLPNGEAYILADYITKDTVVFITTNNYIDEAVVKSILNCYEATAKRSDVDIKRIIIYDPICITDESQVNTLTIDLSKDLRK